MVTNNDDANANDERINSLIPILGVIATYPIFVIVEDYVLLRILFLVLYIGGLFLPVLTYIHSKKIINSSFISKINVDLLWRVWVISFIGTMSIGIVINLLYVPGLKIEEEFETPGHVSMANGNTYQLVSMKYDSDIPCFGIKLHNNSDDNLVFDDRDAIQIDLLEYTPYDNLDISAISYGEGELSPLENPIDLAVELPSEKGKYTASFIIDDNERTSIGAMMKVSGDDTKNLKIKIRPKHRGFYRFKVQLNYSRKGKTKNKKTREYCFVCEAGIDDLKYDRTEVFNQQNADDSLNDINHNSFENQNANIQNEKETNNNDAPKTNQEYNGEWKCITEDTYLSNNAIDELIDYEYNKQGNIERKISYNDEGEINYTIEYTYNRAGNLIRETRQEEKGKKVIPLYAYEYDSKGICKKKTELISDIEKYEKYEYDSKGRLTVITGYNNRSDKPVEKIVHHYDENGSLSKTEKGIYGDDSSFVIESITEYSYDQAGNMLSSNAKYIKNGNRSETKNVYNEAGNRLRTTVTNTYANTSSTHATDYIYDENHNIIKEEPIGGTFYKRFTYEYFEILDTVSEETNKQNHTKTIDTKTIDNTEHIKALKAIINQKKLMSGKSCIYTIQREKIIDIDNQGMYGQWNGISPGMLLGYSMEDFDSDGSRELFVINLTDEYQLKLEMYEVVNGTAVLSDFKIKNSDGTCDAIRLPCGIGNNNDCCGLLSCFINESNHKIFLQISLLKNLSKEIYETAIVSTEYANNKFSDFFITKKKAETGEEELYNNNKDLLDLEVFNADFYSMLYQLSPLINCFDDGVHPILYAEQHMIKNNNLTDSKLVIETEFADLYSSRVNQTILNKDSDSFLPSISYKSGSDPWVCVLEDYYYGNDYIVSKTVHEYDSKARCVYSHSQRAGDESSNDTYTTYSFENNHAEEKHYSYGYLYSAKVIETDDKGLLIRVSNYYNDWDLYGIENYLYQNGRLLEIEYDFPNGMFDSHKELFTYDVDGRLIYKKTASESNIFDTTYYYYDELGNLIKAECYESDEKMVLINRYSYFYDEIGRVVEQRVVFRDKEGYEKITTYYEYDNYGNLSSESNSKKKDEKVTVKYTNVRLSEALKNNMEKRPHFVK